MKKLAFTLIELSIVLVIIGLIVGGALVGRDLIAAAEVRAQISQIEKYQTAVNTFRTKYNYLPGDIPDPAASSFGFQARGTTGGRGDGNGLMGGSGYCTVTAVSTIGNATGENVTLWVDLATANLIGDPMTTGSPNTIPPAVSLTSSPAVKDFFPYAKLKRDNFVYTYSEGSINYFGISAVTGSSCFVISSNATLPVIDSYNIDSKIDDGLPLSGRVVARYLNSALSTSSVVNVGATAGAPAAPSSVTCYDNGNASGVAQAYSVGQNGGNGLNCALSFRF